MLVRLHMIALFRMKKKALIASTALGASITVHVALSVEGQPFIIKTTDRKRLLSELDSEPDFLAFV